MLVLITAEQSYSNEADILNEMFELGLSKLHLRKPNTSVSQYKELLDQIDGKYQSRVVLHEFHHLLEEYAVGGVHLKEQKRLGLGVGLPAYVAQLKAKGKRISSSFHTVADLENIPCDWDYCFLSPVFDSISKKGYKGQKFEVHNLPQKVLALGGVTQKNIQQVKEMGFAGAAVLGSVWQTNNPVQAWKDLVENYRENE